MSDILSEILEDISIIDFPAIFSGIGKTIAFLLLGFILIFIPSLILIITCNIEDKRMIKLLHPIFPTVKTFSYHVYEFLVCGIDCSIILQRNFIYFGNTCFRADFKDGALRRILNKPSKPSDVSLKLKTNRQKYTRIFEITLDEKDPAEDQKNLGEKERNERLIIRTDDPILKKNLKNEKKLLNALWEIYLTSNCAQVDCVLEQDSVTICSFASIKEEQALHTFSLASVRALRECLEFAERQGIHLHLPDSFQEEWSEFYAPEKYLALTSDNIGHDVDQGDSVKSRADFTGDTSESIISKKCEEEAPGTLQDDTEEEDDDTEEEDLFFSRGIGNGTGGVRTAAQSADSFDSAGKPPRSSDSE